MANLRILVPDASTNYITNPAIRSATTGWNSVGSTISRTQERARFGQASLMVVTNGAALREGTYYRVSNMTNISGPCSVSVYVRGSGTIRIRMIDNPRGQEWYSKAVHLNDIRWQRVEVSGRSSGTNDMRLYVETDTRIQATTFYVDGAQMEPKAYATTYIDGEQPGCRWNIMKDASISTRDAETRWGGKWVAIAGPCTGSDDLYVTSMGGLGMPPIEHQKQSWALAPGSFYQGVKITDRVMTFAFHAKNQNKLSGAPKLDKLHQLRETLIDIIKPDKTPAREAFLLEYDEGDYPLYIRARYDTGLDGDWDIRNSWTDSFPVRMIAVDPLWVEDTQEIVSIDTSNIVPYTDFSVAVMGRIDGSWSALKRTGVASATQEVYGMVLGPNGQVYACGDLGAFGYRVVMWDGTTWTEIGSTFNGIIYSIAVAPNGYIFATGAFTNAGGTAATRIAYWNGSTWNAMGTGLNGTGRAIVVMDNGQVLVGGDFTQANSVSRPYIAGWNNGSWYTIGGYTLNNSVRALAKGLDGNTVYVGGDFTVTSTYGHFGYYSMSSNTMTVVSPQIRDGTIYAITVGLDGMVYVGGTFTNAYTQAYTVAVTISILRVAKWDGTAWSAIDGGVNNTVYSLATGTDGRIYVGGDFTQAGTISVRGIAVLEGKSWSRIDIHKSVSGYGTAVSAKKLLAHPNGDLYVGMQFTSSASDSQKCSGITTINNIGTAEVSPVIWIGGSGRLLYLENITSGRRIYIDLTVFSGEEVLIDFSKGTVISNSRGSIVFKLEPNSSIGAFTLTPGNNRIAMFVTDDTGCLVRMFYTPTHWSADAVAGSQD